MPIIIQTIQKAFKIQLVAGLLIMNFSVNAQSEEGHVKAVVNKLFFAMQQADSAGLISCFAPNAHMETISTTKIGTDTIKANSVHQFASSIGRQPVAALDERISFGPIHIDDQLAMVWTPYQFYFKGNFSHCGTNSIQLVKLNGKWKIQYLIDTRRKENCL